MHEPLDNLNHCLIFSIISGFRLTGLPLESKNAKISNDQTTYHCHNYKEALHAVPLDHPILVHPTLDHPTLDHPPLDQAEEAAVFLAALPLARYRVL